jgi:hypothetical protein
MPRSPTSPPSMGRLVDDLQRDLGMARAALEAANTEVWHLQGCLAVLNDSRRVSLYDLVLGLRISQASDRLEAYKGPLLP